MIGTHNAYNQAQQITTIQAIHGDERVTLPNGSIITIPYGYELLLSNERPILNTAGNPTIQPISTNNFHTNTSNWQPRNGGMVHRHNQDVYYSAMQSLCNAIRTDGDISEDEYKFFCENMNVIARKYHMWVEQFPQAAENHLIQARLKIVENILAQYREQRNRNGLGSGITLEDFEVEVYDRDMYVIESNVSFASPKSSKPTVRRPSSLSDAGLLAAPEYTRKSLLSTPESPEVDNVFGYGNACKVIERQESIIDEADAFRYYSGDEPLAFDNPFKPKIEVELDQGNIKQEDDSLHFNLSYKLVGRKDTMNSMADALKKAMEEKVESPEIAPLSWDKVTGEMIEQDTIRFEKLRESNDISTFLAKSHSRVQSIESINELIKVPPFYDAHGFVNEASGYIIECTSEKVKRLPIPYSAFRDFKESNEAFMSDGFLKAWDAYIVNRGNELLYHLTLGDTFPSAESSVDFVDFAKEHKDWLVKHKANARYYDILSQIRDIPNFVVTDPEEIVMSDIMCPSGVAWSFGEFIKPDGDKEKQGETILRAICKNNIFVKEPCVYINTNLLFEGMTQYGEFSVTQIQDELFDVISNSMTMKCPLILITFPRKSGCKRYKVTIPLSATFRNKIKFIPDV